MAPTALRRSDSTVKIGVSEPLQDRIDTLAKLIDIAGEVAVDSTIR